MRYLFKLARKKEFGFLPRTWIQVNGTHRTVSSEELLSTFDFDLPPERIAQEPPADRGASRLLRLARDGRFGIEHRRFDELPDLLRDGDLLVVNDVAVLAARIDLARASGGRVRGLLLEAPRDGSARALLEGRGRLKDGEALHVPGGGTATLAERIGGGEWLLRCDSAETAARLLASGRMPLPPYIARAPHADPRDDLDRERYQTVFAAGALGAVAAPTAGLHFTRGVLDRLAARGVAVASVTLDVGRGTFEPVRTDRLAEHAMHAERFRVPDVTAEAIAAAKRRGGRVVAVGTTVVRTLESAVEDGAVRAGAGSTSLFIRPPFRFRAIDAMITNFHLPKSTLLVLVCAFAGTERVLAAYRAAVAAGYRFFSYGDAMLVE